MQGKMSGHQRPPPPQDAKRVNTGALARASEQADEQMGGLFDCSVHDCVFTTACPCLVFGDTCHKNSTVTSQTKIWIKGMHPKPWTKAYGACFYLCCCPCILLSDMQLCFCHPCVLAQRNRRSTVLLNAFNAIMLEKRTEKKKRFPLARQGKNPMRVRDGAHQIGGEYGFDGCEWYYLDDEGQQKGPFTTAALQRMYWSPANVGSCTGPDLQGIADETMVWSEKMEEMGWTTIGLYPDLKSVLLGESKKEVEDETEEIEIGNGKAPPNQLDMERAVV
jgi:hypothetical protein